MCCEQLNQKRVKEVVCPTGEFNKEVKAAVQSNVRLFTLNKIEANLH